MVESGDYNGGSYSHGHLLNHHYHDDFLTPDWGYADDHCSPTASKAAEVVAGAAVDLVRRCCLVEDLYHVLGGLHLFDLLLHQVCYDHCNDHHANGSGHVFMTGHCGVLHGYHDRADYRPMAALELPVQGLPDQSVATAAAVRVLSDDHQHHRSDCVHLPLAFAAIPPALHSDLPRHSWHHRSC